LDRALSVAREQIGHDEGLSVWMKGWAMPLEEAMREAMDGDLRRSSEAA
jgi:hypothetical protein